MSEVVLSCRGLTKTYSEGKGRLNVLAQLDLELSRGERVAVVGRSGAGKSTLLHVLSGLDHMDSGEIRIRGRRVDQLGERERDRVRNEDLGFVYQLHHLLPEFTALENVAMPLLIRGVSVQRAAERSREVLTQVGLAERLTHRPGELSGGERQRVAIARALVGEPSLVMADEPTGNLDAETAASVHALMLEMSQRTGTAFLIVTHDRVLAAQMDRVLVLRDGALTEQGKRDSDELAP